MVEKPMKPTRTGKSGGSRWTVLGLLAVLLGGALPGDSIAPRPRPQAGRFLVASRNLDDPDPRCPLNFVRHEPLATDARFALKNSFAFGGSNSVVVVGRGD